jgi:hypothetical protein
MGIRGLGCFSLPIQKYMGNDLKNFLLKLFKLSESLLINEEVRKTSM